eukprot:Gb_06679 [translate_table: standard]
MASSNNSKFAAVASLVACRSFSLLLRIAQMDGASYHHKQNFVFLCIFVLRSFLAPSPALGDCTPLLSACTQLRLNVSLMPVMCFHAFNMHPTLERLFSDVSVSQCVVGRSKDVNYTYGFIEDIPREQGEMFQDGEGPSSISIEYEDNIP